MTTLPAATVGAQRWISFDVGETLIDETRAWSIWADVLGIPRLTFMAAFGRAIDRGGEHRDVFAIVDRPDWREQLPRVHRLYGGFREEDLYPDALRTLDALSGAGYRLAVLGNQPAVRTAELRAIGVDVDVMAMSDEMRAAKPHPEFYREALERMGSPDPGSVVYVGDRIDNDVVPAAAAGLRAVWVRRGPWGAVRQDVPREATLVVDSLDELVARVAECWETPTRRPARA